MNDVVSHRWIQPQAKEKVFIVKFWPRGGGECWVVIPPPPPVILAIKEGAVVPPHGSAYVVNHYNGIVLINYNILNQINPYLACV
jgi:hypothetical protein